jgi:hypothetical protein
MQLELQEQQLQLEMVQRLVVLRREERINSVFTYLVHPMKKLFTAFNAMLVVAIIGFVGWNLSKNFLEVSQPALAMKALQSPQCSLTITAIPTPGTSVPVGTTQFDFVHIKFTAPAVCNITLNNVVVGINNNLSSVVAMIQNLKAYNVGTNVQVGNTIVSPAWANNIGSNLGIQIPAGGSVTLAFKADVVGTGSGVLQFGESYTGAVQTGTGNQVGNGYQYWGQWVKITKNLCSATQFNNYVLQWGVSGTQNSQFQFPNSAAVDSFGNVYVVDTVNNRIQKFTSSGVYITQWGSLGTGNGQFYWPVGITVDSAGNVYVADTHNSRIQKFTSNGTYITQWGVLGSGNGQFAGPTGVTVDAAGNVYVVDQSRYFVTTDRVQKFTSNGTYITQWGSIGTGNGQFQQPWGITTDGNGNVYVTDSVNDRVQKFTSNGTYITQWGSSGTGNGQFIMPLGITSDSCGNIYVVDSGDGNPNHTNNRIEEFNSTGIYLNQWGGYGIGNGQFSFPYGITIDSSHNVYVVDTNNNRIQKFN